MSIYRKIVIDCVSAIHIGHKTRQTQAYPRVVRTRASYGKPETCLAVVTKALYIYIQPLIVNMSFISILFMRSVPNA